MNEFLPQYGTKMCNQHAKKKKDRRSDEPLHAFIADITVPRNARKWYKIRVGKETFGSTC